ncbi:methyltransferase [Pseudoclavibacter chungangensis]|uniref:Methyltransferase n=1 Tax=Pseudoclavibacter chungangensis TaxID=587635 RepID=A0A7J5C1Y6_9MICO|nr:methyltransferase [Pseudoclavibacter chungangensis]
MDSPAASGAEPRESAFDDPTDAPRTDDLDAIARLRAALLAADYTVDGVERLLGEEPAAALHRDLLAPASIVLDRAAEADDAQVPGASGLVRLFLLAEPVRAEHVVALDELVALRLVGPADEHGEVRALVDLRPYASDEGLDLWVASDLGGVQLPGLARPLRRDHVVGIGPATTALAQLTPRTPVERALDLGVGMGVQTIHLLAHVAHVVATDISARALAFARFNLLLGAPALGIEPARLDERVSLRLGDLLEPVAGERFGLVVSNPPFVITPRRDDERASEQYTYRDGGRPGDAIVHDLVTGLGDVLEPGGVACMLGNWEIHEGDASWHERVGSWASDDVDLHVVQRERAGGVEYADMWLRDAAENAELGSWRSAFEHYLDDFARRGVDAVGLGMLLLHRRRDASGPVLRRFEEIGTALGQPLGPVVAGEFERVEWLRGLDDTALFDETLVVAGDVTEERHSRPGDEHPSAILLRQGGGFRRTFPLSTELAAFVSVCDGELAGAQIVTAIAALLGLDDTALAVSLAPDVRDLVEFGFLEPAWL